MASAHQFSPLVEALLARVRMTDAEARRIMAESNRDRTPLEAPPVPVPSSPVVAGEMPPWAPVELELNVTDDVVTFVGRDLVTGRPRIKIELARADATTEWIAWIGRWLERKRRGALHLVE